jgi:uncharacterized protein
MVGPDSSCIKLLLDPWSSEFAASVQVDGEDETEVAVGIDVMVETADWGARKPGSPPSSASFVDGVRRLEARLVGWRNGEIIHGLFATFATGAVNVEDGQAVFSGCMAERRLALGSGLARSQSLRVGNIGLEFQSLSSASVRPADLVLAIQNAMRNAEAQLAGSRNTEVTFLDGPLAYVTEPRGPIIGVVKTIHRLYLDPAHMKLVFELQTGERTPVFAIREGRKDRYSWYLRIGNGRPIHHGLSGIVRLETGGAAGLGKAVTLADTSAGYLPRFASTSARDPRAPQNLTPVGALEDHLRKQMGDATLIQRAIERRISEGLFL